MMSRHCFALMLTACLLVLALMQGCSGAQVTAADVRPQFAELQRVAVLGLEPAQEDLFIPMYMVQFPEHTMVERRELEQVLGQDRIQTISGQFDEDLRQQMQQALNVDGTILASIGSDNFTLRAVENDRVFRGGPIYTGPLHNLFMIERYAKRYFPEEFEAQLFDRDHLATIITDGVDE
jgi:hypothetical protein